MRAVPSWEAAIALPEPLALALLEGAVLAGPEASILDLRSTMRGFRFSLDAMWAAVEAALDAQG